ncbi:acyl-CoA thioesterase [Algicola sagamiensis]|uniref:acyl-CoA thioesterase n=1 Tax=Algicola sagamiensis TaxID=163869 RepID=UPI00036D0BE7|nr:acyl-CoA thioesterase [Algicola sagamiensis]
MALGRQVDLRFLAEPMHVNFGGKVHGGIVMKWIDQAAYACAAGWSRSYCVTVSVGAIKFGHPILVGQVVELSAKVIHTGKTSMQILVTVKAGDPKSGALGYTNHCIITFVATDGQGNLIEVPKWEPKTKKDKILEQYALEMKAFSLEIEKKYDIFE